ncbi:hypothetical protein E1A91_D04G098200v1 [Gossypium mustelinum]|uniref:Uncharacterized protein n=1 Tax=Gossypium mustelinum TaxID=34275 RepID=A0A5D2VC01_GOSMU|nr:hypothetical protein E1A91_D04G098200v1 [Gossypium mustelinum]
MARSYGYLGGRLHGLCFFCFVGAVLLYKPQHHRFSMTKRKPRTAFSCSSSSWSRMNPSPNQTQPPRTAPPLASSTLIVLSSRVCF